MGDPVQVRKPLGRRADLRVVADELDAVFDALDRAGCIFSHKVVDFGAFDGFAVGKGRIDVGERAARGRVDLAQRFERGVVSRLGGVFDEQLRVAQNVVHGRAEVMAQLGERGVFERIWSDW